MIQILEGRQESQRLSPARIRRSCGTQHSVTSFALNFLPWKACHTGTGEMRQGAEAFGTGSKPTFLGGGAQNRLRLRASQIDIAKDILDFDFAGVTNLRFSCCESRETK
jgi:hypothetical protein